MKTRYLLPHHYKTLGWIVFFPALIMGLWQLLANLEPNWLSLRVPALFYGNDKNWVPVAFIQNNLADEICAALLILGALLIVFARERDEDEFIMKLRMESVLWATLINGLILIFSIVLVYDVAFFYVMIFNLFLLFLLFIGRFHWVLYKFRKEAE